MISYSKIGFMTAMYGIWRSMAAYGVSELFYCCTFACGKGQKPREDEKGATSDHPWPLLTQEGN